jgi:hypothetical protein
VLFVGFENTHSIRPVVWFTHFHVTCTPPALEHVVDAASAEILCTAERSMFFHWDFAYELRLTDGREPTAVSREPDNTSGNLAEPPFLN